MNTRPISQSGRSRHRPSTKSGTPSLRLLKVGAHIRVTARCVWVALTDYLPDADLFILAANRLHQARAPA